MLPLAISIVASTLFSLTIKDAHRRECTLLAVGATNYLTAAAIYVVAALVGMARAGWPAPAGRTLAMGAGAGVLFVVAFVLLAELQERRGISITTAALRLSVAFPVLASMLFWGESARGAQIAGLALAALALPLLGFTRSGPRPAASTGPATAPADATGTSRAGVDVGTLLVTAGLFVANGLVGVSVRLYHEVGAPEERVVFFAALFVTAAVSSRVVLLVARRGIARRDLLPGVFLGIWNTGASFLLLVSLATLPGFVAFPLQSALALVLTAAAAAAIWKERVSLAGGAGIVLAVAAAVLLNL